MAVHLLDLSPMTWLQWKVSYLPGIRVCHALTRLKNPKPQAHVATSKSKIRYPWYKKGDWMDGRYRMFELGKSPVLWRGPAILYEGTFLILDGCHRLSDLKPSMVVLDYLKISKREKVYVVDLLGNTTK